MSNLAKKLLVLGGLTTNPETLFKFCEPEGTPRDVLFDGLLNGTYKKPFLVEELEYRSLCFALDGCTQSEMRIAKPYELVNEYTRKMMGFLAFQPRPDRVLMVGLGGGSIVKYCHRYLPATQVVAVEIDPDVIALRGQFCIPPDDEHLKVIQADGAVYLAGMAQDKANVNAILVDAFDHNGIASAVVQPTFIEHAKQVLGTRGVLVMNLVGEVDECKHYVAIIRESFGEGVIVIATQRGSNLVVFASQTMTDPQRLRMAARNAERYENRLGLFFPTLIQRLTELADHWGLGASHAFK